MKIDIVNKDFTYTGKALTIHTKDGGIYAIKQFAIPCISKETGTFNGSQNPSIKDTLEILQQYGNIWVMRTSNEYGYPTTYLEDKLVTSVPEKYFEKIFNKDEIRKISLELLNKQDWWNNDNNIQNVGTPKRTILGKIGSYLNDKFE